jgi:hypothetical protein
MKRCYNCEEPVKSPGAAEAHRRAVLHNKKRLEEAFLDFEARYANLPAEGSNDKS